MELLAITPAYIDFGLVKIAPEKSGNNTVSHRTENPTKPGKSVKGSGGACITREFTITNRGTKPISISGITANPGDVLAVFPQKTITLKAGEKKRLQVRLTPAKNAWMMNGALLIKSDLADLPEKIVYVSAEFVEGK